jgi:hypothetical protein
MRMNDIVQRDPWFCEPIKIASSFNYYKKRPAKSQAEVTRFPLRYYIIGRKWKRFRKIFTGDGRGGGSAGSRGA